MRKTAPQLGIRPLLLLALYVAAALAPAAHRVLAELGGACESCPAATAGGPVLQPNCQIPCRNPTHHHHPGHDEQQCPTCQSGTALASLPPGPGVAIAAAHTERLLPLPATPPVRNHDIRISPARAPPVMCNA